MHRRFVAALLFGPRGVCGVRAIRHRNKAALERTRSKRWRACGGSKAR
jgi:hypothetical protein